MAEQRYREEDARPPAAPGSESTAQAASAALAASAAGEHGEAEDNVMPDEEILYDLADLFKIFSDTTRIKILYSLIDGEHRVADIADMVGATQSAVSHQLRVLKQARLVRFQRDGKNIVYSLADDHVLTILAQGMNHICE